MTKSLNIFATILATLTLTISLAKASNISLSATHNQDTLYIGQNTVDIESVGSSIFASIDINDNLAISANSSQQNGDTEYKEVSLVDYQADNWGLGLSYSIDDWWLSFSYGKTKESLSVERAIRDTLVYQESYTAPTYSANLGYGNFFTHADSWFWSANLSVQFTDWQQDILRNERVDGQWQTTTGQVEGENLFANLSMSVSNYTATSEQTGYYYGSTLSWHYLLSGKSTIVAVNGYSTIDIVRNFRFINASNFSQQVDAEEYGMLSFYGGYDFNSALSVELALSSSFGAENNASSATLSVIYSF